MKFLSKSQVSGQGCCSVPWPGGLPWSQQEEESNGVILQASYAPNNLASQSLLHRNPANPDTSAEALNPQQEPTPLKHIRIP